MCFKLIQLPREEIKPEGCQRLILTKREGTPGHMNSSMECKTLIEGWMTNTLVVKRTTFFINNEKIAHKKISVKKVLYQQPTPMSQCQSHFLVYLVRDAKGFEMEKSREGVLRVEKRLIIHVIIIVFYSYSYSHSYSLLTFGFLLVCLNNN